MIYAELYLTNPATNSQLLLTTAVGLTFDVQSDFRPSTISFAVTKDEVTAKDIRSGKFFIIKTDSATVPPAYVLEGDGLDYVTEDGVIMSSFSGRSLHCLGEDAVVFPSAWPNPAPSGHAFQNSTPGTMILTLVSRAQNDRGTLTAWTTSSFTGTHDSNGVTWPSMADRTFSNGDSYLQVFQSLIDDGLVELAVVGFDLRAYVPGTLGAQRTLTFRPGYGLAEGSVTRDATDMATDVFAIGDGAAAVHRTNPSLYDTIGRRREKFVQYGGIGDNNILGLLADAQLAQSGHVKQEDTIKVPHSVYNPFSDYALDDWVNLDRGAGTVESVQIKQITVNQSGDDYDVSVVLGDLMDTQDQKLARRIDAITGANAGGGAVPSDKTDDKLAPAAPASVTTSSLGYIDQNGNRKVAALVDWPDVATNSNGTPADDIDHYEYQFRTSTSKPSGTTSALSPGRPNTTLNTLFDRRSKALGWVGGDGVAAARNTTTGKDYWAFGDSGIGVLDATGRFAKGINYDIVHNAIVVTDPAVSTSFQSVYGKPNMLPSGVARGTYRGIAATANCTVVVSPEWDGFGGLGFKMSVTATAPPSATALIGQDFFGDKGSKAMVAGQKYTVKVRLRKAVTPRSVKIGIQTYDSTGAAQAPVTVSVTESATKDVDANVVVTAPAGAVKGNPWWEVTPAAAGEVHGSARWGLFDGDASGQLWNASDHSVADSLVNPYAIDADSAATTGAWQTDLLRGTLAQTSTERRVAFLGDSVSEGVGASAWYNRTQTIFQNLARVRFPSASGKKQQAVGYIPGVWAGWTVSTTTLAGGAVLLDSQYGLGQRTVKIPTGGSVTYPAMACDSIDVYYQQNDFFPGIIRVSIDGGALVKDIDTTGPATTGQRPKHFSIQMPRALSGSNMHTVVVSGIVSDSYFNGIEFRDSQSDGLYVIDSSHTGFKTDDYRGASSAVANQWASLRDARVTHLVVMLGANDMASYTPAQWGANISDFIGRAQTEIAPGGWPVPITFLHWGKLPNQPAAAGANPQDLALYEAAAIDAASRYLNVEVVLMSRFWPDGSFVWSGDGIHPNDAGAEFFAQQILRRTWDQRNSNFIWFGSIWSALSKFFITGMEIGTSPVLRTNMLPNPTFGTTVGSTSGWGLYAGTTVSTVDSSVWTASGKGFAIKVKTPTSAASTYIAPNADTGGFRAGMVAGKTYTFSGWSYIKTAWVGPFNATATRVANIIAYYKNAAGAYVEVQGTPRTRSAGAVWYSLTFSIPADATEAFVRLYHGGGVNDDLYWDNMVLEERPTPISSGDYFDGSTLPSGSDSVAVAWDRGSVDNAPSRLVGTTAVVPQLTRVMQYDAPSLALERVDTFGSPDTDTTKQWTTTAWTEDATYVYIYGKNSANQPVVARAPLSDPYTVANIRVWNGSTWAASGSALPVNTDPYTFDSIRKVGSTYSAYYMIGFNPNIYRKTATSLTGPWTTDATVVYKTPESGANVMTYIPRMYPQLDSQSGTVYGYSTNLISAGWGAPVLGPRFAWGPQAGLVPVDLDTQTYGSVLTTVESKAFASDFQTNTAFQAMVRTVDTSGLVSPWTTSVASILAGTPGDTLVAPSKPSASASFQGALVVWNGLDANGNRPTNEWGGVQVHASPDGEFFQPSYLTQKGLMPIYGPDGGPNVFPVQDLDPGKAYWFKLVAVGKPPSGGLSDPSAADTCVTERLVADDITPGIISDAALGKGVVHAENLSVASYSEQLVPNANFEDGFENNLPKTWSLLNRYTGNGDVSPQQLTGSQAIGGSASLGLTVTPGNGRVIRSQIVALVPGDLYYFAAMLQTSRALATDNSVTVAMLYSTSADPATFASYGIGTMSDIKLPDAAFKGSVAAPMKVEGQLKVPANMTYGCMAIIATPDVNATTSVFVTVDDTQFKRVVGTANLANAAINNAKIADLAVDFAKIASVKAGTILSDVLTADLTLSGRIMTAATGQRVELNTNGLAAYNSSDLVPVTQVTTDGGLVSKYLRTNTSGTRIEMGTYANGGGSANIAFFDSSGSWQFPPVVGYGGGGAVNYPGVAMHSGSRSVADYNTYGLSMIGLDQKGGIGIITGMKLDGTQSTTGSSFTVNAGGAGDIDLIAGGGDYSKLHLDAVLNQSYLTLNGGALYFDTYATTVVNSLQRGNIAWNGFPQYHMVMNATRGLRIVGTSNDLFTVASNGDLNGSGDWGVPKIRTRDTGWYVSWDSAGNIYKNGSTISGKSFVIDHPNKPDNYLVHVSSEMPEARVEYTANAKLEPAPRIAGPGAPLMKDNFVGANDVEISLPDYFKDLVTIDPDTTVVTVSAYYHDCDDCGFHGTPSIAATKVTPEGTFRVKATGGYYHPCISFAWRVSAIRKDIPETIVEPLKSDYTLHGDGPYTYLTKNKNVKAAHV